MAEIGIGIIGCGGMGMAIVRRILKLSDRLSVVGLCDPDQRSIESALKELSPRPRFYNEFRQLVAAPDVQWVMIASWNSYHCEQAVAALEAGKHVFCQKPLALNLDQCLAIYRAWKRSESMFNIGFTLRYSPHFRKIKQLLDEGAVGRIISMEFNETLHFNHGGFIMGDWRRLQEHAGTHLLEKCCHDIDLANWMTGSVAIRVASFGGLDFFLPENEKRIRRIGKDSEGKEAYTSWPGLVRLNPFTSDKDIVDNQVAIIEYANGVRATFHTNCNAAIPERRMYILGTEGALRADVLTGTIQVKRIDFETKIEDASTSACGSHGGGDDVLAKELVASMLRQTPPAAGIIEGLMSAVTCFAIDEAMDSGTVVSLDPYWKKTGLAELAD